MLTIRLARTGAKKKPFYHIVVTDSRRKRDGRCLERVGFFNPLAEGREIPLKMDMERIDHWRSLGAQTSDRVLTLIKQNAAVTHAPASGAQAAEPRPPTSEAQAAASETQAAEPIPPASEAQAAEPGPAA